MADEKKDGQGGAHVHGGITMGPAGSHGSGAPPPVAAAQDEHHASHPSWKLYVLIGLALTIITAIEVAIFYIPQLASVLVPTLLILSAGKFITVVLFYMHLKFDSPVFSRVFFAPMCLAIVVILALIVLFKVLPAYDVWK